MFAPCRDQKLAKDQAKATEVGKLRRRLENVLGGDPRFVSIKTGQDRWALNGDRPPYVRRNAGFVIAAVTCSSGWMMAGAGARSLPHCFEHGSSSGVFDLATKVRIGRHAYSAMT